MYIEQQKKRGVDLMPQKLALVRHAHVDANPSSPDTPLSVIGQEQARITGAALQETLEGTVSILHSPYVRAMQTATIIARSITERKSIASLTSSTLLQEQRISSPNKHSHYVPLGTFRSYYRSLFERGEDGESLADVCSRALELIESLRYSKSESMVLVTHGDTWSVLRFVLETRPIEDLIDWQRIAPKHCEAALYQVADTFTLESVGTLY